MTKRTYVCAGCGTHSPHGNAVTIWRELERQGWCMTLRGDYRFHHRGKPMPLCPQCLSHWGLQQRER